MHGLVGRRWQSRLAGSSNPAGALIQSFPDTIFSGFLILSMQQFSIRQALYNAESGIHQALSALPRRQNTVDHFKRDSVIAFDNQFPGTVEVQEWGAFLIIRSRAIFKNRKAAITALVGESMPAAFDHSVLIGKCRYPLVIDEHCHIKGDLVVGNEGVLVDTQGDKRISD